MKEQSRVSLVQIMIILEQIMGGLRHETNLGLCGTVSRLLDTKGYLGGGHAWECIYRGLMADWPKSTGSTTYPVPNPDYLNGETLKACMNNEAKAIYHQTDDVWIGRYGELRLELAQYMFDTIDTHLRDEDKV
jgi:hypothetical protein